MQQSRLTRSFGWVFGILSRRIVINRFQQYFRGYFFMILSRGGDVIEDVIECRV